MEMSYPDYVAEYEALLKTFLSLQGSSVYAKKLLDLEDENPVRATDYSVWLMETAGFDCWYQLHHRIRKAERKGGR